jgi:hypothetical protein
VVEEGTHHGLLSAAAADPLSSLGGLAVGGSAGSVLRYADLAALQLKGPSRLAAGGSAAAGGL